MNKKILFSLLLIKFSIVSMSQEDLTELIKAAMYVGDNAKATKLIEELDPNAKIDGEPLIIYCHKKQLVDSFNKLINQIDPDSKVNGEPLTSYFFKCNLLNSFFDLISRGANINGVDANGNTILHLIAAEYPLEFEYFVIGKYVKGWIRNFVKYDVNSTPMKCYENFLVIHTQLLIFSGINIFLRNNAGKTPLSIAFGNNNEIFIKLLNEYESFIRENNLYTTEGIDFKEAGRLYKVHLEQKAAKEKELQKRELNERREREAREAKEAYERKKEEDRLVKAQTEQEEQKRLAIQERIAQEEQLKKSKSGCCTIM